MGSRITVAAALLGMTCLLSACTGETNARSGAETAGTGTASTQPSSEAQAPAASDCPVGDWQVTTITGKSGAQVNGVPVVATSGGGFTLALGSSGTWTLTGNNAPVTLTAAGRSVTAVVDGTAEGQYTKSGDTYLFRQQRATGKVTLKQPVAGVSSWPMQDVGPALAPSGTATLTCGPGTLRIASESVVLDLNASGAPTQSTPTTGTVTLTESGQSKTIPCDGRTVAINGSANKYTFTGECAAVNVNGARNEIRIATATEISVNGSFNKVTWSAGEPKTSNTGQGNTISQG
ncbi:DUF3060 domain-containing protein [Actinophytocola sp.]|uniref:DUF3060 domain-containing protein n=1 Tax=Actinophytocola sp. TaxID=1872138 RepID=UPI002D7E8219|nr:DUF3060 domain-containing protein [Actinophytocola sp.]HET9140726.1 DUF3060 domain-containing protein [Actinophytocola sp.]